MTNRTLFLLATTIISGFAAPVFAQTIPLSPVSPLSPNTPKPTKPAAPNDVTRGVIVGADLEGANFNTLTITNQIPKATVRQIGSANRVGGTLVNQVSTPATPTTSQVVVIQSGDLNAANFYGSVNKATVRVAQSGNGNNFLLSTSGTIPDASIVSNAIGDNNKVTITGIPYKISHTINGNGNTVTEKSGNPQRGSTGGVTDLTIRGDNNIVNRDMDGNLSYLEAGRAHASISGSGNTVNQTSVDGGRVSLDVENSTGGTYTQKAWYDDINAYGNYRGYPSVVTSTVKNATNSGVNLDAIGTDVIALNTKQENVAGSNITYDRTTLDPKTAPVIGYQYGSQLVGAGTVNMNQVNTTNSTIEVHSNGGGDPYRRGLPVNMTIEQLGNVTQYGGLDPINASVDNSKVKVLSHNSQTSVKIKQTADNATANVQLVGTAPGTTSYSEVKVNQGFVPYFSGDVQVESRNVTLNANVTGNNNNIGVTQTGFSNTATLNITGNGNSAGVEQFGAGNRLSMDIKGDNNNVTASQGKHNQASSNSNVMNVKILPLNELGAAMGYSAPGASSALPTNNRLTLMQSGSGNLMNANAYGTNGSLSLNQSGNNNRLTATIGGNGANLNVNQSGYNLNLAIGSTSSTPMNYNQTNYATTLNGQRI